MTDYPEIAAHVARDLADGKLTTLREDGLYRHVEFTALQGWSRVVLVTWPYNLLVAGSHGSYHFERHGDDTEDMFNWLRGIRVEPRGWASKLVNGADSVREYDRERLVAEVKAEVKDAVKNGAPRGLRAAVREQILESDRLHSRDWAMQMVYDFEHGVTYRAECSCGATEDHDERTSAYTWEFYKHPVRRLDGEHKVTVRETGGFAFSDVGDWNLDKLNYHFVYQCHAASWAIRQYDASRKSAEVAA
ncbi:hypothetical protein TUSST3_08520 [Streptomyces sp. TUS-ST3]|uniref:hypothetical protein n=1 Tax=Streptomyces sp. TUS-ST3 TaxID=3025591 RepID=UPI0024E0CAF8|nr:hypothetical protein [Streptomyces sp. TUS-ST3]GLP64232.1 hypothetical protein TUSST3_08520 [Streptomyces sp. TUS-ST3]